MTEEVHEWKKIVQIRNKELVKQTKEYTKLGWNPIPCIGKEPAKHTKNEKGRPVKAGYLKLNLSTEQQVEEYFKKEKLFIDDKTLINVAIANDNKKKLVDIDLDCDSSRLLAPFYLPPTKSKFGRPSTLNAHWIYNCPGAEYEKFYYLHSLRAVSNKDNSVTMLEIRPLDSNRYTVFPPSYHVSSGEFISWSGDFQEPSDTTPKELKESCTLLAVASILSDHWESGIRQDLTLAVCGTLLKMDWEKEKILELLDPIFQLLDDSQDVKDRKQGIDITCKKFESGKPITGVAKLSELLPESKFYKIKELLGIAKLECPVIEKDGCLNVQLFVKDRMIINRISSFVMNPIKSIFVPSVGSSFEVNLKSRNGESQVEMIDSEAFTSAKHLKSVLCKFRNFQDFTYTGTDNDTQNILDYLNGQDHERVTGTSYTGFMDIDGKTHFITEHGAMSHNSTKSNITYMGTEKSNCKLQIGTRPKKNSLRTLKRRMMKFNEPSVIQGVLGWTISCFFKDLFTDTIGIEGFPLLYLSGESGSGKSQTAKSVIYGIWGVDEPLLDFGGQTQFTLMTSASLSNNIPMVLDEVKLNRMSQQQKKMFSNYVRASFDGSHMKRGNKDKTITYYPIRRPTVVCSEVWPDEVAIKERCLFINMSQKESYQRSSDYQKFIEEDLDKIGKLVLEYALKPDQTEVEDLFTETYESLPNSFEGRPRISLLASAFGLNVLNKILNVDFRTQELEDKLNIHFYGDKRKDGSLLKISEVDKTIMQFNLMCEYSGESSDFGSMINRTYLQNDHHYSIKGDELRLHINGVMSLFPTYANESKYQGDILDSKTFRSQVMNEVYFVKFKTAKIGGKGRHCLILNLKKMLEKGLEITHPWVGVEENKSQTVDGRKIIPIKESM